MKKYLISGIGPGPTGVGRLMVQLTKEAKRHQYTNIYKFANKSIRKLIKERRFLQLFVELFFRTIKDVRFYFLIKDIKESEVILIHPQSLGIQNFKKLLEKNTIVKWYVMDNSFFCMKSYNYLNGECLKCLDSLNNIDNSCKPYPNPYAKDEYIEFMEFLRYKINSIKVYAQSDSHKELLKKFYGDGIDVSVVGMDTGEFDFSKQVKEDLDSERENTIVFHNHLVDAKGFSYAYELAKNLPQYRFVFPSRKPYNINADYKHIEFLDITWDCGLKDLVKKARLVLCLSMWSSPIEGALVKSIFYNGNVAVVNNMYGFNTEIPDDVILKLNKDIDLSKKQIENFMENNIEYTKSSQQWLKDRYNKYDITKIFERD
jgi:hypothetical protein